MSQSGSILGGGSGGSGNVVGPGSSTDNALARFDGTTGKIIQNGITVETDEGQLQSADGDVGTPTYSFLNSPTTGMYSSAPNTLNFGANDTNLLELQGNGTLHPKGPVLLESGLGYNVTLPAGSTTTTVNDGFIGVDTSVARTITLVASPDFGQLYRIQDITGSGGTNNITIAGNGKLINGVSSLIIDTNFGSAELVYDGVAWFSTISTATSASTLITTYDTAASPATWTKNPRTKYVEAFGWAGGSGGASGRKGISTASGGGSGGAAGGTFYMFCPASFLGPTETVIIGSGGSGGAAQGTDLTNGNPGIVGTLTKFGNVTCLPGTPGAGGSTGTAAAQTAGSLVTPISQVVGAQSGTGNATSPASGASIVGNAWIRATGGGGGAGYDLVTPRTGGSAGSIDDISSNVIVAGGSGGVESGTINGGNGNPPLSSGGTFCAGTGGGGGGGPSVGTTPGNGGNGAVPGGGGGGGSGGISGTSSSGAGGNGANGRVIVIEYF